MGTYITALLFGLCLVGGVVIFARREGKQAARLEALKREIKEHERASQMVTTVRNIPIDRVRDKLQQTK